MSLKIHDGGRNDDVEGLLDNDDLARARQELDRLESSNGVLWLEAVLLFLFVVSASVVTYVAVKIW